MLEKGVIKNLKGSKLGQILRADKTPGFCRLGHILRSMCALIGSILFRSILVL